MFEYIIFPHEIYLNICKRVKTEEDRHKLKDIEDLLVKTETPVSEII